MPEDATDLIYYAAKDQLIVVGVSCTLYVLGRVDPESPWYPVTEMRFSSGTGEAASKLQVCVCVCMCVCVCVLWKMQV